MRLHGYILLAAIILGIILIPTGTKASYISNSLRIYPNPYIAMADVYTPWTKNLSLGFEMKATPCLNWTEYVFSHIVKGPFVRETSYDGWEIVGVTYTASPETKGVEYHYPSYLLNKTLIVARKGSNLIIISIYKNVGDKNIVLAQPMSHIHRGVMALTLRIVPSSCNSPFGKYINGKTCTHKLLYTQTLPATEVKAMLNPLTVTFSDGSEYKYLDLGLWNTYPPGKLEFRDGKYYAIVFPVNTCSTTEQIQIVSNWYYWNDKLIGYGELNLQHAKVILRPGESAKFVYAVTINEPFENNFIHMIKTIEPKIYETYLHPIPTPTPSPTQTSTPAPTPTPTLPPPIPTPTPPIPIYLTTLEIVAIVAIVIVVIVALVILKQTRPKKKEEIIEEETLED